MQAFYITVYISKHSTVLYFHSLLQIFCKYSIFCTFEYRLVQFRWFFVNLLNYVPYVLSCPICVVFYVLSCPTWSRDSRGSCPKWYHGSRTSHLTCSTVKHYDMQYPLIKYYYSSFIHKWYKPPGSINIRQLHHVNSSTRTH